MNEITVVKDTDLAAGSKTIWVKTPVSRMLWVKVVSYRNLWKGWSRAEVSWPSVGGVEVDLYSVFASMVSRAETLAKRMDEDHRKKGILDVS